MAVVLRAASCAAAACALVWASPARGAEDIALTVFASSEEAVVYQVGLLDRPLERILEALNSGVPSRVQIVVELWRKRARWLDRLEWSVSDEFIVTHDPLLDEFEVRTGVPVWRSFAGADDLASWLMAPGPGELRPGERLRHDARYFLAAEVRIEPFTAEQMGAVERWLSGEKDGGEGDGVGGYLLGIVVRMSGLGDLTVGGRSEPFQPGRE